jgi:5-methylcytosine-specific restriction endonuclease McrA
MPINYKEYPPNWKEIRDRILLRADYKCEKCNAPHHGKTKNKKLIILTIAHLDHDHTNHKVSDTRLMALCQKCHLAYDMKRHVAKRMYGTDYFKQQELNLTYEHIL